MKKPALRAVGAAGARALLTTLGLAGCAATPSVARAYDGQVVIGRYLRSGAYTEFLRGAIAEASGRSSEALEAYAEALRLDPQGVEIWTRIAAVRCALSAKAPGSDEALSRAFALDDHFAPAWAVKATCALSRGDQATARSAAEKAVELDPRADDANVLLADTAPAARLGPAREALVALTMTAQDPVLAWDALAAWSEAHGDVALRSLSFQRLVKIAPERRAPAARAAEKLAMSGEIGGARAVAAAAADASDLPLPEGTYALAARLAVDEAIARGDPALVRARATRVRVTLEEASARALLAGDAPLSYEIASHVALADDADAGVRLVLAAGNRRDVLAAMAEARRVRRPVSGAAWVALGEALAFAVSPAQARAVLAAVAHEPIVAGDDLVARRSL